MSKQSETVKVYVDIRFQGHINVPREEADLIIETLADKGYVCNMVTDVAPNMEYFEMAHAHNPGFEQVEFDINEFRLAKDSE